MFYVVELESPLELGMYHIKMEFESELRDQPLSGLYRLDYKRKDGTKVWVGVTRTLSPAQTDSQVKHKSTQNLQNIELAYGLAMGGQTDSQVGSQFHASRKTP